MENPTIRASIDVARAKTRTLSKVTPMQSQVLSFSRYAPLSIFIATSIIRPAPINGAQTSNNPVTLPAIKAPTIGIPNCAAPNAPPRTAASRLVRPLWQIPIQIETEKASIAIETAVAKVPRSAVTTQ